MYQADIPMYMKHFQGDYSFALNSEDLHVPDLALNKTRSKGGTLIMWKHALDPYITVALFIPQLFYQSSFINQAFNPASILAFTSLQLEKILSISLNYQVWKLSLKIPWINHQILQYLYGGRTNEIRVKIFTSFAQEYQLARVPINLHTYHHFMGHGQSDSELDVILFSDLPGFSEGILAIQCNLLHPLVDSHHDLLVSTSSLPVKSEAPQQNPQNIIAPIVTNTRQRIVWSEEGISKYQVIVANLLQELRSHWLDPSKQSCISILIQATNFIMDFAASSTNKTISLSKKSPIKPVKILKIIRKSIPIGGFKSQYN